MNGLKNVLEKISSSVYKVEKVILVLAVIVEVGLNFINVILRYGTGHSIAACETLSVVLFMLMILLGGNIAVKSDSEIKIDLIHFKSEKTMAIYKMVVEVICIAAVCWLLAGTVSMTQNALKMPSQVIPLPIYTYHEYFLMIAGLVLVLLDHLILFLKRALVLTTDNGGAKA